MKEKTNELPVSGGRSSLDLYLNEIRRYPLLSREDEVALARKARAGDMQAQEKLDRSNLRFVVSIAKKYVGNGVPLEDLINDGNVGLVKAAERFDPERGFKFISYAVWWIRQSILVSVSENSRMIRMPMNRVGLAQKATKISRKLEQDLGRDPDAEELAKELGVTREEIEEVTTFSQATLSLDQPVHDEGNETTFVDQIVDDRNASPDQGAYEDSLKRDMDRALESLTDRERTILVRYYGLNGVKARTLEDIGKEMGYTRERIRQIKEQAIDKLRSRPQSAQYIEDYLTA
ncbi:MAG TPA: RNA polymerase sigma factor RpoD/SigA [Candidatus Krumholzibacteria bacterium]|nr:RNA polymerase sigma factor RpoD/SigA [Candidatus Krumholzibacteria bacterium]